MVNKNEKQTADAKNNATKAKKNCKRHKEKLEKLEQKKIEYEQDLTKVEAMPEDLIEKYIDETFYHKQVQYSEAIKEIEEKSYTSSRQGSRPSLTPDISRPSRGDSTYSGTDLFEPSSLSETSGIHDTDNVDLDVSAIENFYDIQRKRAETKKLKEERRESLFRQFNGSRLS